MKLEQDQMKKIGISLGVLIAFLYGYFTFLLNPLKDGEQKSIDGIASLGPQITDANKQIATTADLEKKAPAATAFLTNLKNSIPDGEPIAWFPPKMSAFFRSHGIEKCTTRLVSETDDVMPGFRRIVWAIDVPKVEYIPLGVAISTLENDEPLINVLNVTVDASREDAQYQHATLTLTTLVKS
jgi:hypothetical protein